MLEFRLLRADEIDARISQCGSWGVQLLLYKDARCDMNILDETVGAMNWQRHHSRENANCIVSIWDSEKCQWIEKEDTGTESNTEREKGLASDSFKRACFAWGIGRELYSAPAMFVRANDLKTLEERNGKWTCKDAFEVTDICYEGHRISSVTVKNLKTGKGLSFGTATPRNHFEKTGNERISPEEADRLVTACEAAGKTVQKALEACKKTTITEITKTQYRALMAQLGTAA